MLLKLTKMNMNLIYKLEIFRNVSDVLVYFYDTSLVLNLWQDFHVDPIEFCYFLAFPISISFQLQTPFYIMNDGSELRLLGLSNWPTFWVTHLNLTPSLSEFSHEIFLKTIFLNFFCSWCSTVFRLNIICAFTKSRGYYKLLMIIWFKIKLVY